MRRPEPDPVSPERARELLDGESLERCADYRMIGDRLRRIQAEESMQQSRVANVDLG